MGPIKRKLKFSSAQIIMLGFAGLILVGALLLMLPISSNDGTVTPFLDCLFTATSAGCVTGLIVPPSDPESLAKAMETLWHDEKLCSKMRENIENVWKPTMSWNIIAKQYIKVYE